MALVLRPDPAGRYQLRTEPGPLIIGFIRPGLLLPLPSYAANALAPAQAAALAPLEPQPTELTALDPRAASIRNAR